MRILTRFCKVHFMSPGQLPRGQQLPTRTTAPRQLPTGTTAHLDSCPKAVHRSTLLFHPLYRLSVSALRHVRGVRPNRAADFRGPPFWTLKIPYKLTCQFERLWCLKYGANILPLIAVLTKEPEMLQPDAFCEHTMQQNATAAWIIVQAFVTIVFMYIY